MSYALVVGLVGVVLAQPASPAAEQRHEFHEQLMGMSFRIVVYSADPDTANRASRRAFERIQQLNDILSDYQEDSELSLLGKTSGSGTEVPLSDDLDRVLRAAVDLAGQTNGAFDPTVGPLTRLWRRTRRSRQLPPPRRAGQGTGAGGVPAPEAGGRSARRRAEGGRDAAGPGGDRCRVCD